MAATGIPSDGEWGSSRFGYKRTVKVSKNQFVDFAEELIKRSYIKRKICTCF